MATTKKKSMRKWIIAAVVLAVAAFAGYKYWKSTRSAVPPTAAQSQPAAVLDPFSLGTARKGSAEPHRK